MKKSSDKMPTVLIVDDEPKIQNVVSRSLASSGYDPLIASNGDEALGKAKVQKPDIVLLDVNMPGKDGFAVCKELRADPITRLTPVLMLTSRSAIDDKIEGFDNGADDYLLKPFDLSELRARISVLLNRTKKMMSANPLTRLPGSPSIQEEIDLTIRTGKKFGVAYIDIDNFKAYNDVYGYHHGDLAITWLAKMIQRVTREANSNFLEHPHFVGHIGGDDFILISELDSIKDLCHTIAEEFDKNRSTWYNWWHSRQGYIQTKDRQGNSHRFPLMTLSIGVSTNEIRKITHYAEVAQITSELKKFAKTRSQKDKSSVVFDRRIS